MFPTREILLKPFSFYAQMRKEAPIFFDEKFNAWGVFRYKDVRRVLADHENFSRHLMVKTSTSKEKNKNLVFLSVHYEDPPDHTTLRHALAAGFNERLFAEVSDLISKKIGGLFERALSGGEMEVINDFAAPLILQIFRLLLDIPADIDGKVVKWMESFTSLDLTSPNWKQSYVDRERVYEEMSDYFLRHVKAKEKRKGDSLVDRLLAAKSDTLTVERIAAFCCLLIITIDVLKLFIGDAFFCLIEHPEAIGLLKEKPDTLTPVLEEVLRYLGPAQAMNRIAARDVEFGGHKIEAGQSIVTWIASANHDETVFADADQFRPLREKNPHIAFGFGDHYCLGEPLARAAMRIVLPEFARRAKDPALSMAHPPERLPHFMFYGFKQLRIRL